MLITNLTLQLSTTISTTTRIITTGRGCPCGNHRGAFYTTELHSTEASCLTTSLSYLQVFPTVLGSTNDTLFWPGSCELAAPMSSESVVLQFHLALAHCVTHLQFLGWLSSSLVCDLVLSSARQSHLHNVLLLQLVPLMLDHLRTSSSCFSLSNSILIRSVSFSWLHCSFCRYTSSSSSLLLLVQPALHFLPMLFALHFSHLLSA